MCTIDEYEVDCERCGSLSRWGECPACYERLETTNADLLAALKGLMDDGKLSTDWRDKDEEGYPTPQLQQREDLSDEEYLTDGIPRVFRVPLEAWLAARAAILKAKEKS